MANVGLKNRIILIAVAISIFSLDQATKILIQNSMELGESRAVLGNFLRLTYILNPNGLMGISFGPWTRYFLLPFSIIALSSIVYFYYRWQNKNILADVSLGMVLSGAAGNLLDRFRQGSVIDFIDCDFPNINIPPFKLWFIKFGGYYLDRWYTFNVADSAVLIGVVMLLLLTIHEKPQA